MKSSSLLCVAAMFVGAACGSVSSPNVNGDAAVDTVAAGDFGIAVNPTTLSLTIAGSGTAAIDLSRGAGFADTVELSASGVPTGVSVGFANMSLPDGTNTTNMTVTVLSSATPGTSDITVIGTAGTLMRTATLSLTLSTVTVTGHIRGNRQNVTVRLVGKAVTTSDTNGNFTYTDVIVPYDIYTVASEGNIGSPIPAVHYYKGLTRVDPNLTAASTTGLFLIQNNGTVTGTKSGAGNLTDAVAILWSTGGNQDSTLSTGNYSLSAGFFGTSSTGTLHGIQYTRGTLNAPTGYLGYGTTAATITTAGPNDVDLVMAAVANTADIVGTISSPAGFPTPTVNLDQQFHSNTAVLWTATTTNAACKIPVIGAYKSAFHATTSTGGRTSQFVFPGISANTDVTFQLPTPPVQTGPAANATNVTSATPIEFTTSPMTVFTVSILSNSAHYHVHTATGSITIPAVSELPIPSATQFSWTVTGFGPIATNDGAADVSAPEYVYPYDYDGTTHFQTDTPARTFTTQ